MSIGAPVDDGFVSILALGINHKTAPVQVREKVAFTPDRIAHALTELRQFARVPEAAILSTCNRVEIYCRGDHTSLDATCQWLAHHHQLSLEEIQQSIYAHTDEQAIAHMMRVACGLDSMVLGEPQILGQLKDAYNVAQVTGSVGTQLDRLFQQIFSVAKRVRSETQIGSSPVSVAYAAVSLARRIFDDLTEATALFVGAGETIELAARHLRNQGVTNLIVANRTLERAQSVAELFDGEAIRLQQIPDHLARADIVIASTASPLPILGKGLVERAIHSRKHRPMFMVDLAVPRDIEPEVSDLKDIYLYTVDDLRDVIQENMKARQAAAAEAEDIIAVQAAHFMRWLNSLGAIGTLRTYRQKYHFIGEMELERAQELLRRGDDPELVLREFSHRLTKKFLHAPTRFLRDAGAQSDDDALQMARRLFDLPTEDGTSRTSSNDGVGKSANKVASKVTGKAATNTDTPDPSESKAAALGEKNIRNEEKHSE